MPIFAVVLLEAPSDDFKKSLESLDVYSDNAPYLWLIQDEKTSKELCDELGFSNELKRKGMIMSIDYSYFGFANGDMWEWISTRKNRES